MSHLIKSEASFALNRELVNSPFSYLFLGLLPEGYMSFNDKLLYITEIRQIITKIEENLDNSLTRYHWLRIVAGFTSSITIAGSFSLSPLLGLGLSASSVLSSVASIFSTYEVSQKVNPVLLSLKQHRLLFNLKSTEQWGILWEIGGTENFLRALYIASDKPIVNDRLKVIDGKSHWDIATEYIRMAKGLQVEEFFVRGKEIKTKYERGESVLPAASNTIDSFQQPRDIPRLEPNFENHISDNQTCQPPIMNLSSGLKPEDISDCYSQPAKPRSDSALDIADDMARKVKSTIISASPRTGKGVVVSQAIQKIRQYHPSMEVWLIDPKDQPSERGYWDCLPDYRRAHYDIRDWTVDVDAAVECFENLLIDFNRSEAPQKLLVIDEFVTLNQKLPASFTKRLKDFLTGICSSGSTSPDESKSLGRFAWVITQSPSTADMGFKTKAGSISFDRLFLISQANWGMLNLAENYGFTNTPPDNFKHSVNASESKRGYYHSRSNKWGVVPRYTVNLSNTSAEPSGNEIQSLNSITDKSFNKISDGVNQNPDIKKPAEPVEPEAELTELRELGSSELNSEPALESSTYTPGRLKAPQVVGLILNMKDLGCNQDQIIRMIWNAKKGGSAAYIKARAEYEELKVQYFPED